MVTSAKLSVPVALKYLVAAMSTRIGSSLGKKRLESVETWQSRESCGSSLLAAIPFAAIAGLSLASPMLLAGPRFAVTLALLLAAVGLAIRGWPWRTDVVVARSGQVRTSQGRLLLRQPRRLSLSAVRDSLDKSSGYRFQLLGEDGDGANCLLLSARDPEVIVARALQLSERLGLSVDVQLRTLGARLAFEPNPGTTGAAPTHEPIGQLPRFPRYVPWLAWGGCLFVWALAGSLLQAHLARGGAISATSMLLFALLCSIGLLLPHWALGTRFWTETHTCGEEGPASAGEVIAPASDVTLVAQGLFGQTRLAKWKHPSESTWLLSPGVGGQWYLLQRDEQRLRSLRLATRPDPLDELAPSLDLR